MKRPLPLALSLLLATLSFAPAIHAADAFPNDGLLDLDAMIGAGDSQVSAYQQQQTQEQQVQTDRIAYVDTPAEAPALSAIDSVAPIGTLTTTQADYVFPAQKSATMMALTEQPPQRATENSISACYAKEILSSAKDGAPNYRKGKFGRNCAKYVANFLHDAGIPISRGDAANFWRIPKSDPSIGYLEQMGFVNIADQRDGNNNRIGVDNAPPGAVITFNGPKVDHYEETGSYPSKAQRRREGTTAGSYVGHITVKGDDGVYYTDGQTYKPAVSHRSLSGVWVMKSCPKCDASLRRKCGDI